jgi:hypothetical protein
MERIDLWIRDKDYAIIVENKVHWANDQLEQLARYIDKTKTKGYKEEQIYVVYLSPTYEKIPDEQTWGSYKNSFEKRFINLSFRDDILSWLTNAVLPNVRLKDKYLSSALEQYIDHIEGMFELRNINKKINMELQKFIKQELELTGTPQENIAKLEAKQKEIIKLISQIELMRNDFEEEIFRELKSIIKTKHSKYKLMENGVGLIIPVKGTTVQVTLGIYQQDLYCQVDTRHHENVILPQEVIEKVGHLLTRKSNNDCIWKDFPRYTYDKTFDIMCEVINIIADIKE